MEQKDWILDNIRHIVKTKGIKLTSLGNDLGKSQGEISKILNGERENYTDYLPQIAKSLGATVHELVQNNSLSQHLGEVKDHGVGNVHTLNKTDNNQYEERLRDKDQIIKSKDEIIKNKSESEEYWKAKYYRLKDKLPVKN